MPVFCDWEFKYIFYSDPGIMYFKFEQIVLRTNLEGSEKLKAIVENKQQKMPLKVTLVNYHRLLTRLFCGKCIIFLYKYKYFLHYINRKIFRKKEIY